MAKKSIKVLIDDIETNVVIRRMKKREVKDLAFKIAEKADDLTSYLNNKNIKDFSISDFIVKNIDFLFDELIKPFVEIQSESIDEMDVVDIINLGKELLSFNNINVEKIKNFFMSFWKMFISEAQKNQTPINFNGIPLQK